MNFINIFFINIIIDIIYIIINIIIDIIINIIISIFNKNHSNKNNNNYNIIILINYHIMLKIPIISTQTHYMQYRNFTLLKVSYFEEINMFGVLK